MVYIFVYKSFVSISLMIALLIMIITVLFFAYSYADYPDMNMNATPNPVGSGARAMGMGGAFMSVADDATAASWNPGGLLQLTKPEISFVISHFSGIINYATSGVEGDIEDHSPHVWHLNYCSVVLPFLLSKRNFVFSFNYQHLYEFSIDNHSTWKEVNSQAMIDCVHTSNKYQRGSLNTLSPSLAIQITPALFFGVTCNFWGNGILDNGWENKTVQDTVGLDLGSEKTSHSEIYERYDFTGVNMHYGFLFKSDYHEILGAKRKFRVGGVIKTPFDADIQHKREDIFYEEYPDNPVFNNYKESSKSQDLVLKMPLSYGLGVSMDCSDSFSLSLDVYHTHWDKYVLVYPSGVKRSPINKKIEEEADIKPTTTLRVGAEYLIQSPKGIIPLRMGGFYDPEPSTAQPDDIYGISLGTGISYRELFSFDCAYQLRFGHKKQVDSMHGEDISCRIFQHYLYISIICYLF